MSELAQLPTPAMARRMGLGMDCLLRCLRVSARVSAGLVPAVARSRVVSAAIRSSSQLMSRRDAVGGVLDDGAGVDVEARRGPSSALAEPLDQQGAAALEQREAGLGGEVAGEGQAQPEAAGVVGWRRSRPAARAKSCRPASVIR